MPPTVHLNHLTTPILIDLLVTKEEVKNDLKLSEIIAELEKNEDGALDFTLQQRMLRYKGRVVISKSSTLLPTILHTYHDCSFRGILGI